MCASRVCPTCDVRDARLRRAPHHEAGRERVELKIDAAATMLIDLAFRELIFPAFLSRPTEAMPCSVEGVFQGRLVDGAGCGARVSVRTQIRARVVSDTARAVARRGCLQWLDADGLKGGASRLDKARSARWSEPGRAARAERRHMWSAGRARVPVTRHAGAFTEVPSRYEAPPALRSLFYGRGEENRETGAAGRPKNKTPAQRSVG
jgi:hypothetical protein